MPAPPLLQKKPACACGGGCPRCRDKLPVQTKLAVSEPGDSYEREADRVADEVMRMATPAVQRKPSLLSLNPHSLPLSHLDDIGSGQPLDSATRNFFEPRFGHDFGHVRVHTDQKAAASAQALTARAYTAGSNVFFAAGQYVPQTEPGRRLMAHELTHTVQQAGGGPGIGSANGDAPLLQRQFEDPGKPPPPPDVECRIDPFMLARLLRGDKRAALRVLDCCLSDVPVVGSGCTSSLVDAACKLQPDLCEEKKKEKKDKKKPKCPPGFRPARSTALQGRCCPERKAIELESECCAPERMVTRFGIPECCKPPAAPNDDRTRCVVPSLEPCPSDRAVPLFKPGVFVPIFACECLPESRQNLKERVCCPAGQDGSSGTCVPEGENPKPPPAPPFTILERFVIGFEKDAPQTWFDPRASFRVSVTAKGKEAFRALVVRLEEHPEERTQLEARASSEKPANDPEYNRRLTDRRVKLIADELRKEKIDVAARVADPPGQAPDPGCDPLATGQLSCGDNGAKTPPDKDDRKAVATVFTVTPAP